MNILKINAKADATTIASVKLGSVGNGGRTFELVTDNDAKDDFFVVEFSRQEALAVVEMLAEQLGVEIKSFPVAV